MRQDIKIFTGRFTAKMVVASCILLAAASSATSGETGLHFDSTAPSSQTVGNAKIVYQTKTVTSPKTNFLNKNPIVIKTSGQNSIKIDTLSMKADVDQKLFAMVDEKMKAEAVKEEAMKGNIGDSGVMQEIQKKVMADRMQGDSLQDSMRNSLQEAVTGKKSSNFLSEELMVR